MGDPKITVKDVWIQIDVSNCPFCSTQIVFVQGKETAECTECGAKVKIGDSHISKPKTHQIRVGAQLLSTMLGCDCCRRRPEMIESSHKVCEYCLDLAEHGLAKEMGREVGRTKKDARDDTHIPF